MRVLACLTGQHNLWLVLLAGIMCLCGSFVTVRLMRRTLAETGTARLHWCFLSAVTAGAAIWATHFIAMLGYDPGVPITFDGPLTIASALIAVSGTCAGLLIASQTRGAFAAICGGGTIGLAIAAMHYVGMFAYRADGVVSWLPGYVIASILASVVLAALAMHRLLAADGRWPHLPIALLVLAILALHFTGMAAFVVTPVAALGSGADSETFASMAAAIALVALLIVGTGISTHLVELRTRTDSQDRLHHIAMHDALTGLANRHHFNEVLKANCRRLARSDAGDEGCGFALMMVDLDRFKPVNDTLGHPVGDEVLRKAASRLRRAMRDGDLVARIGGDEFAIIAPGAADEEAASLLAGRIVEILSRPIVIDGQVAEIGGSVGVALAPRDGSDAMTLMQNVDVALYAAKRGGKNRFCRFDASQIEEIHRRRALEAELRRAAVREEFRVVYQPVIDAGSGRFTGAEALVRWDCPERGEVAPSEFIPLAEELGLICAIGAIVLRQACQDAVHWPGDLVVSVNLSPVQLADARLPAQVAQILAETGLPPARLELEITETALLENDELALRTLKRLCELGVTISLDDFGTGYSSLSYLHRFPISRIKIDRSFVQRLPEDAGSASIVRAIAQLGESLGMKITAEGIETDEQFEFLSRHGCNHVQGFLISRPIAAIDVAAMFATGTRKAVA